MKPLNELKILWDSTGTGTFIQVQIICYFPFIRTEVLSRVGQIQDYLLRNFLAVHKHVYYPGTGIYGFGTAYIL